MRASRPVIASAALALLLGLWAGSHFQAGRPARQVRTPAGAASPASPKDLEPALPAEGLFGAPGSPPAGLTRRIPERLPQFSLGDRSGKPTPIGTWAGRSLILNFWATWCAPCRREIPLLERLSQDWADRRFTVVGIAVDHRDQVNAYAAELKIPYPILVGEQDALDVAADLGMTAPAFPFTVFTDDRGEIVTLYVGELHRDQVDLILSAVQSVNRHALDLAAARERIAAGLHAMTEPHAG